MNKAAACVASNIAVGEFGDATRESPTPEEYGAALQKLAFTLGDEALDVGDTGGSDIEMLIASLATETADTADEYLETGEISTRRWLAFRTSMKAVSDLCTHHWEVED